MIDFSQIKINDLALGSVFLNDKTWIVLISKIEKILFFRGEEIKHIQLQFLELDFSFNDNFLIKEYCLPIDKSVEYFIGTALSFDLIMA